MPVPAVDFNTGQAALFTRAELNEKISNLLKAYKEMETVRLAQDTTRLPIGFASALEVKWCLGCVAYSILKQVQTVFPQLTIPKENVWNISGICCSSRTTDDKDTYGTHAIHSRSG